MSLLSVFFYLQNCLSFEILVFSQDIWGNGHYVPEINLISWGTLIKAFYFSNKTIWRKSETGFCRRKTAEDNNAKIVVFPNIPCTFLLFKAVSGKLPPRKIAHRSGSGFGLGLALELVLGGNFPWGKFSKNPSKLVHSFIY